MAEDLARLQSQRAQAEQAGDAAAVARFDARIARVGMELQGQDQERLQQGQDQQVNPAWDVLRSVGQGLRGAVEGTVGTPQDLATLAGKGVGWATGTEQNWDIPYFPGTEEVNAVTSQFVGNYEPQTTAGQYAKTIGEFAPMLINPFAGGRKIGMDILESTIPAIVSETAGQVTEGTALEPLARGVTGLGTGMATSAGREGLAGVMTAEKRAAEAAAEDAALQHGVRLTRGERTGNVSQQMEEQQMLRGARGNYAQQALEQRRRANLEAIKDAGQTIASDVAPTRGVDPVQSGGLLNEQTRGRAEDLMNRGGKSIEDAINEGVIVDTERLRGLPAELEGKLTGVDPYIPDVVIDANTPIALKAKNTIDAAIKKYTDNPNQIDESMGAVERLRRTIGKMEGATPEDRRAMKKLMQGFDEWYDDTITNDAAVAKTGSQFALPSARDPKDILADLRGGRATFKEGADIARPRGKPEGGKEVAKIATEGTLPEETARLFKPNDRGDMSSSAIKTIERLKKVGATSEDLDQVRGIVLDTLLTGDPGKVSTRVDNFIRNNQTAANSLFTPEQLDRLKNWKKTNEALVPKKEAINPSQSSYGIIGEVAKQGARGATGNLSLIGSILGGVPGAVAGAAGGGVKGMVEAGTQAFKAKSALSPADRRLASQYALAGAGRGARIALPGSLQAGQTMTIVDPGGADDGRQGKVVEIGKNMVRLRMPDGKIKQIGKALVK